jgi:hypothetical protein
MTSKTESQRVGGWLQRIVRDCSAWAWRREIETCESVALIKEMHVKPGSMEITIQQNPALAQWVAQCFASMIADSPNYTEMKFNLVAKLEKWEWITILIQKGNGKTPHQLRQEAEKERDELRARLDFSNESYWSAKPRINVASMHNGKDDLR